MKFRPRFSLKMLLALVAVAAVVSAASVWYAYRIRTINAERARFSGIWRLDGGAKMEFIGDEFDVGMPSNGIGRFDINMTSGRTTKGIYRFVGDKVEIAQSKPGKPRPTNFEKVDGHSIWSAKRTAPEAPQP